MSSPAPRRSASSVARRLRITRRSTFSSGENGEENPGRQAKDGPSSWMNRFVFNAEKPRSRTWAAAASTPARSVMAGP